MLFLQIYLLVAAIFTALMLKAVSIMPSGPKNLGSAILLSLIVGLTWPLGLMIILVETIDGE